MTAFIDVRHVTYTYPNAGDVTRPALDDVNLRIEEGEFVAIVGANGSGKSTLARHLNALLTPDSGYVRVGGHNTSDGAHHPEIRRNVGMVFQRPDDQIVATLVAQDVAFGLENLGLPPDEIRARVEDALRGLDLWRERDRPPHMLSAGQMQRLALAGVLVMRPRCVIFDEATAMLDPVGRRSVRSAMQELHRDGLTIIGITHRMEQALDADRVVVLDQGRVALDAPPSAVFSDLDRLQALGLDLPPLYTLSARLRSVIPGLPAAPASVEELIQAIDNTPHATRRRLGAVDTSAPKRQTYIRVRSLSHTYMRGTPFARQSLAGVGTTIGVGEAHGLVGATGSGKSTLMQHLNGLLRPQQGSVRIGNWELSDPETDLRAVRRRIGLVFQQPEAQIFEQFVGDEIAFGPRLAGLAGDDLRMRVQWAMGLVGLNFDLFKDRLTFTLSGGERRKVALASTLALKPEALLLDEPTAGLDPLARAELLVHLGHLQEDGTTLLLSSHEMEDIAVITEAVTVLVDGTTALRGPLDEVFADAKRLHAWGLEQPMVTQVGEGLRDLGWPVPAGLTDPSSLKAELKVAIEGATL